MRGFVFRYPGGGAGRLSRVFAEMTEIPPYRDPDFQQRYHAALKAAGLRE
jgi:hypothetical protein